MTPYLKYYTTKRTEIIQHDVLSESSYNELKEYEPMMYRSTYSDYAVGMKIANEEYVKSQQEALDDIGYIAVLDKIVMEAGACADVDANDTKVAEVEALTDFNNWIGLEQEQKFLDNIEKLKQEFLAE